VAHYEQFINATGHRQPENWNDGKEGKDQWDGTSPVGSFPANSFGLYDIAGNLCVLLTPPKNAGRLENGHSK